MKCKECSGTLTLRGTSENEKYYLKHYTCRVCGLEQSKLIKKGK